VSTADTAGRNAREPSSGDPKRRSRSLSQEGFEERLRRRREAKRPRRTGASTGKVGPAAVPDAGQVRSGLDVGLLDELLEQLELSQEALAGMIGVSMRTLQRRRSEEGGGRLTPAESDRLWRLLHVWDRALAALGSAAAARAWLTEPKAVLGGEPPAHHLDTEPGLREVEDMLTVLAETGAA